MLNDANGEAVGFCRENYLRQLHHRFTTDVWEIRPNGNYTARVYPYLVTFFRDKETLEWVWVCAGRFSQVKFRDLARARSNAFWALKQP